MEDFQAAFLQRSRDVKILEASGRRAAAMHFGGVTVECLLKYIICNALPKNTKGEKEWKTETNDPGHSIANPGHSYQRAINCHSQLRRRIQEFPEVLQWLNDVEHPDIPFIAMRYSGQEPDDERYRQWEKSYKRLLAWLQRQAT